MDMIRDADVDSEVGIWMNAVVFMNMPHIFMAGLSIASLRKEKNRSDGPVAPLRLHFAEHFSFQNQGSIRSKTSSGPSSPPDTRRLGTHAYLESRREPPPPFAICVARNLNCPRSAERRQNGIDIWSSERVNGRYEKVK